MQGDSGAPTRIRTPDQLLTKELLYRLSYEGIAAPGIAQALNRGEAGAGEGNRTLDTQLGKLMFYH